MILSGMMKNNFLYRVKIQENYHIKTKFKSIQISKQKQKPEKPEKNVPKNPKRFLNF